MSKEQKQLKKAQARGKSEPEAVSYEDSPGTQLVKGRERLGLTQEQVAERLHLRINSVKAVEEDALEEGVSVTFNKGYVRLYAKLVHLEVQPLLDAYERLHASDSHPAKLQSFSRRVSRETHDSRWNMVTIVVVLLVVGSVIGWWVQRPDSVDESEGIVSETIDSLFSESDSQSNSLTSNEYSNTGAANANAMRLNEDSSAMRANTGPEILDDGLSVTQSEVGGLAPIDDAETEDGEAMSEQIISTTQSDDDNLAAGPTSVNGFEINADGSVNMAFTFKDDCWVSVKDINDEVLAVGLKTKGRVMEISGLPPIRVVLGAPQNVAINVGSKDIDMSVYPSGRTANFLLSVESD
jgi:cytoskeleton protein RodZ